VDNSALPGPRAVRRGTRQGAIVLGRAATAYTRDR